MSTNLYHTKHFRVHINREHPNHEVSLDFEKIAIKVEFEISLNKDSLSVNVHGYDVFDLEQAIAYLSDEEQILINQLFFNGLSEREFAAKKGLS